MCGVTSGLVAYGLAEGIAPVPHYTFDFVANLFSQEHRTLLASHWPKEAGTDAVCI